MFLKDIKELKEKINKLDEELLKNNKEFEKLIEHLNLVREDFVEIKPNFWRGFYGFEKVISQRFVKKPNKK